MGYKDQSSKGWRKRSFGGCAREASLGTALELSLGVRGDGPLHSRQRGRGVFHLKEPCE